MVRKSHKSLPIEDIMRLLDHNECSVKNLCTYLNILFLVVVITFGVRPTAIKNLKMSQFKEKVTADEETINFIQTVGDSTGCSKTKRDGLKYLNRTDTHPIWNIDLIDDIINIYKLIKDFISRRPSKSSDRFILQVNHRAGPKDSFFKRQIIGSTSSDHC